MDWLKTFWSRFFAPDPHKALINFTPKAQQVLALAREEAARLNHNFVGTEHLLLGLIKLESGIAATALLNMGVTVEDVRRGIENYIAAADKTVSGRSPYTPRVKKALALASKESRALKHKYVGTEHILLGLLREGDGVAARVLKNLGVDIEGLRQNILQQLDPNFSPGSEGKISTNFTPMSEEVLNLASDEANRVKHNFIGTEHLLLALIKLRRGIAFKVLTNMGVNLDEMVQDIEQQMGAGLDKRVAGPFPYTPAVKRMLALAKAERDTFGHSYLGTEHILLGLLRESDAFASRTLNKFGVDIETTRQNILKELDPNPPPPSGLCSL